MASSTRTRSRKRTSSAKVSSTAQRIAAAVDKQEVVKPVVKSQPVVKESVQVRPAQPNLKWEDYRDDVKVRWQIHQYETKELWNDLIKGYEFTKPFVGKSVTYVKDSYNKAFN